MLVKQMPGSYNITKGFTDCRDLLSLNAKNGGERKPHCDSMVYEIIDILDRIIQNK